VILALIVLSSIKLVIGTYLKDDYLKEHNPGALAALNWIDNIFTILFTLECVAKIMRNGFFVDRGSYLRDPWSVLDFIIVISSIIDWSLESVNLPILKVEVL